MNEIWNLYDKDERRTGIKYERDKESEISEGKYHPVVEIWVINYQGDILLTQRHPNKKHGLLWQCSGGSVLTDETSIQGAVRELREETGIIVSENDLEFVGSIILHNYIVDSYRYVENIDVHTLKLQAEEVVDAKMVTPDEFEEINRNGEVVKSLWERFCHLQNDIYRL